MILAGDIGGTKSLFALFELRENILIPIMEKEYPSQEIASLEDTVKDFLAENPLFLKKRALQGASFSLAGPVYDAKVSLVNLDLTLDLETIRDSLSFIPFIEFYNDLQGLGAGLLSLKAHDLLCLHQGSSAYPNSNKAVIAPGTGLGEALIMEGQYVYATEGGHSDFGPQSQEEVALWHFLQRKFGHVSYERILSGPGLVNIYHFLTQETNWERQAESIPSPVEISQNALARTCPFCQQALEIFVRILGAEAGNLALKSLSLGGVYLGGGIPPQIIPKLQEKTFLKAFQHKGRFSSLMEQIPVYIILNERTPLYGAALMAARQLGYPQIQIQY